MGPWGAGGLSDPPPGMSSCCLTQSSRSLVDGHRGPCWPCQCRQSKAKKWAKAGAAGGARRESEAAPCVRALNREAWPGAWPWGQSSECCLPREGVWGAESRQAPGLGTSPSLCGWPARAHLSLPENMENHREVPTTPRAGPCPPFGGSHMRPAWKLWSQVGGEVLLSSKVMGEGWGKPLSWGQGSSGSPCQAARRVALPSTRHRPALSPAGPRWQKSPCLGTWGGPLTRSWGPCRHPRLPHAKGVGCSGSQAPHSPCLFSPMQQPRVYSTRKQMELR